MGDDYSPALIAAPTLQYKYMWFLITKSGFLTCLTQYHQQDCISVHSTLYTARRDNYSRLYTYRVTSHVNMGVFEVI